MKTYYDFFKELSLIPRESGKEEKIQQFLLNFAKEHGLHAFREDVSGNIVIQKPASKGYEHLPGVILQGHMDMVCEKTPDSTHNFDTDGIELIEEGSILRANNTTLGADNGIGVAYAMAVLSDHSLSHPELEAIFTTQEETTMYGAENLQENTLKGKYLLNLDSEEEGVFYVSSAGGSDFQGKLEGTRALSQKNCTLELVISKLHGGHSGMNIASGFGNANKIIGRVLYQLNQIVPFDLISIEGGSKPNAIPRDAKAVINIEETNLSRLSSVLQNLEQSLLQELAPVDSLSLSFQKIDFVESVFTESNKHSVISFLSMVPNGVQTMSQEIKHLVESSQNLGIVRTTDNIVSFIISIRSSVKSLADWIGEKNLLLAKLCRIDGMVHNGYPGWEYQPTSPLRELALAVYQKKYGQKAEISAIHAGLECVFFAKKYPNTDIISFGPNLHHVHSPKEYMELDSADRVYDYLILLLKEMIRL